MIYSLKRPNLLVYAIRDNLIFRNITFPNASRVYCEHRSRITCVAEQKTNGKFAFGDEKGLVTVVALRDSGEIVKEKEFNMLGQEINQLCWSNDGTRLVAIGAGNEIKAAGVTFDTGSKCGTILGITANCLCADLAHIEKKYALFSAGESNEIMIHDGIPFKGQGTGSGNVHTSFVNALKVSPDNSKFVTVSSDKSIKIFAVADLKGGALASVDAAHEMGIYDVRWLNDNTIATCSADNTLKTWTVTSEEAGCKIEEKDTYHQKEGPRDTSMQLLGFADTSDTLTAVNLSGDLCTFDAFLEGSARHPSSFIKGHQNLISDIVNFDKYMVYASENNLYYFDSANPNHVRQVEGTPNKNAVLELFANNHSVYATTLDKLVLRLVASDDGIKFDKSLDLKSAASKGIGAADDVIYVLKSNGELEEVDAVEMTVKREHKLTCDPTAITFSDATKEIWVGDKKGLLHVLKAEDFSEVHSIEKHSKAVTCLAVTACGKHVASGDAYRYQYIWDSATRTMTGEHGFQKDKITSLRFNKDGTRLVSTSTDLSIGVVNLTDNSTKKKANPHSVKALSHAAFCANGDLYSAGDDCVIRIWKNI